MNQNKKLTLGILLTFIICIGSAILATYSTGPYGNYPNPGVHPGMIGPGTFNASGVANPSWVIPGILNMDNNRITNISMPVANSDVATKGYVDAASGGGNNWFYDDWNFLGEFTVNSGNGCKNWNKGITVETGFTLPTSAREIAICTNIGNVPECTILFTMTPPYSENKELTTTFIRSDSTIHKLYTHLIPTTSMGDQTLFSGNQVSHDASLYCYMRSSCSGGGRTQRTPYYKVKILENRKVVIYYFINSGAASTRHLDFNWVVSGRVWYK